LYEGKVAHKEYTTLLSEAREGIPLNKEEFYMIDRVLSQAIKRGQHLYHIMKSNNLSISKSTAYRHLHRGYLSVSKLDFPRVVKFKVRKQAPGDYIPKATKIGRTYKDFLTYLNENNIQSFVEMDTVIGRIGGKTILTLNFNNCNFIIGILLDSKSSKSVTEKIQELKANLTKHSVQFGDLFRIILTDNGGEFANVTAFENALDGTLESNVFFCDPFQSSQKPRVEKNHTLFRDIVPKGSSFDNFTQETVNLIFSHVNCVKRKNLQGRSAYDIFVFLYGKYIANLLGISEIPADKVIQSPKLLKK
jgi:IS30 family transposase